VPVLIPAFLVAAIVAPYLVLPALVAIPASFAGVVLVAWWSSWRQRPKEGVSGAASRRLRLPVRGQWHSLNTPARKVPSHGTHFLAQTYAFDFVAVDDELRTSSNLDWRARLWLRPPESFYAFGQPIVSPCSGQVVASSDRSRDHRSRDSLPGLVIWFGAQLPRSFMGARGLIGNHLVLRIDDGAYAVFAHLRRGSLKVGVGDEVVEGQVIASCGNSGNSTEPHLHFQLMDRPDVWWARGLPVAFDDYEVVTKHQGWITVTNGVPDRGERFRVH